MIGNNCWSVLLMLLAPLIHHCRSDLAISLNRVGYPGTNDPENRVTLRCTGASSDVNFTLNGTVIGPGIVRNYSQVVEENVARFIVTQGEEGYYACEEDENVSNSVTITAFLEDVSSAPEQNIMASKGAPVDLLCPYRSGALKEHYTIEWIYTSANSSIIYVYTKGDEEQYRILDDYTLRFENVSSAQNGKYRCRVKLTLGIGVNPRIYDGPDIHFSTIQDSMPPGETSSGIGSTQIIIIFSCVSIVALIISITIVTIAIYYRVRSKFPNSNSDDLERGVSCRMSTESKTTAEFPNVAVSTPEQIESVVPSIPRSNSMGEQNFEVQRDENRNEELSDRERIKLATDVPQPTKLQEPIEERSAMDSEEHTIVKEGLQFIAPQNTSGNSWEYSSSLEYSSKSAASKLTSPMSPVTKLPGVASRSTSESVHSSTPSGMHSSTAGGLSYMSRSSIYSEPLEVVDYIDPDMSFLDPIEVIQCSSSGGKYTSQVHGVTLKIPSGAIPQGIAMRIEFGVTLSGPFSFPTNTRRISPIVWLCIQQTQPTPFGFLKPVEVKLPHYLDLTSEDSIRSLQLKYLKASHDCDEAQTFHFDTEGEAIFQPRSSYGTIHTQHFCFICLVAAAQCDLTPSSYYFLMRVIPRPVSSTAWDINFCVGHFLQTFIESVKRQYRGGRDFKISHNKFKFKTEAGSEPKIAIGFTRSPPGGWQLALESGSEIQAAEVDVWTIDPSHFDINSMKSYPPRFTIEVSGEGATEASWVEVSFTGVNDHHKLNTSLPLPLVNRTSHEIARLNVAAAPGSISIPTPVPLHGLRNYSGLVLSPATYICQDLIGTGQQDPDVPTDEEFEKVVAEVAAKLRNNWNTLQTFLRIPLYLQVEIDQQPTIRLKILRSLQDWRSLNYGQASRSKLAECIRRTDPSLHAIADKLKNGELLVY